MIPPPSEREFQRQVIEYARLHGWRTLHIRPARTAHGWRTPVAGQGVGFPDILCVGERVPVAGRLVVVELKSARGKLTEAQKEWLAALALAGVETHVWKPDSWPEIERILGNGS